MTPPVLTAEALDRIRRSVALYVPSERVADIAVVCAQARQALTLHAEVAALTRELERWRHGWDVDEDRICPDSLALTEARVENERLRTRLDQLTDALARSYERQGIRLNPRS